MRSLAHQRGQWLAITPLDQALPPTIVGALRQRFARLSPTSIDHLRIAAIIGRTFDLGLLAAIEAKGMCDEVLGGPSQIMLPFSPATNVSGDMQERWKY